MTGASRPTALTVLAGALTLASITGTAGYLLGRYPVLPIVIPVEFRDGHPLQFVAKSRVIVLMPLWTQLILLIVIGGVVALLLWRARGAGEGEHAGEDAARMLHAAEAIALLGFVWIAFQAVTAVSLVELWRKFYGGMGRVYDGGLVAAVLLSITIAVRAASRIGRPAARHGDDGRVWRLKALYFNPTDPALFVPSRHGSGLTLNFGRPIAIAIMLAILLVGLGGPLFLARLLLR